MADVKLALEEAKEESESGAIAAAPARYGRRFGFAALAILVVLGIAIAVFWSNRRTAPTQPILTRLTSDSGWTGSPALSPDGKLVAYESDRGSDGLNIWVRQISGGEPIQITHEEAGASHPSFSPDSRIAFRSERDGGGVFVVSALGGEPRLVLKGAYEPRFSPDGRWIAVAPSPVGGRDAVRIIPPMGGEPRRIGSDLNYASNPLWSPDGTALLVVGRTSTDPNDFSDWWLVPIDGSRSRKLGIQAFSEAQRMGLCFPTAWAGNHVYGCGGKGSELTIWRTALNVKAGQLEGPPERLTFGSANETNPSAALLAGGGVRVVFASASGNYDIWSLPADANRGRVLGGIQRLTDVRRWMRGP